MNKKRNFRSSASFEGLEPYYGDVDGIVDNVIKGAVTKGQLKHFEACKFKVKALWYIKDKIEELDNRYLKSVSLCMEEENFSHFVKLPSDTGYEYEYFPFFEAIEFENILSQGKACFDTFSKAVGSLFNECPNNLEKLEVVLKHNVAKRDKRAGEVLKTIHFADKIKGVILDPKVGNKKSIRDLISHQEKANIKFLVSKNKDGKFTCSKGALLGFRHPQMVLLNNYLVNNIASAIWYYTMITVEKSFKAAFPKT